jgi:hypothetical protein
LSRLPGVSLDVDLKKDVFDITYDPKKLTPERFLEVVKKEGFEGTILPNDATK